MNNKIKNIIKIATAGIAAIGFGFWVKNATTPMTEVIESGGYEADIEKTLTCYDDNGEIVLEDNPENIVALNIDPVSLRIIYPEVLNEHYHNIGQPSSIIMGVSGCIFSTTYTASDTTDIQNAATMIVTIFNETGASLHQNRYTNFDYSRDSHMFNAALEDENGVLLETIEVIGLRTHGSFSPPTALEQ